MSLAPKPVPIQRRLFFLGVCVFGYIVLMAGWWISTRAQRNAPPMPLVTLSIQPFVPASNEVAGAAAQLTSDLPNAFSKVVGLRVIPTGMAETAAAVLNGSVSGAGGNLNIDAKLSRPQGAPIWSKRYTASESQPTLVSRDIATDVLAALRNTFKPSGEHEH